MSLRLDGKVAIVTGAGAGIGRCYALLLASRGAKVVVNDLGSVDGKQVADRVVAEIKAAGGVAVANYNSCIDGEAVVGTALKAFGRIDIIINNAGILRDRSFHRQTDAEWDIVLKVHLYGCRNMCQAAWPHMRKQKYGRIVNITSVNGLYGQFGQTNYSAAKSGVIGFSKALAKEGAKKNIKVNVVAPGAGSAMTKTVIPANIVEAWKPEYVAPIIAFLAHEDVPCSGSVFEAGGGYFAQVRMERSAGVFLDLDKGFTVEDIQSNFDKITSMTDSVDPEGPDAGNPQLEQILARL